MNVLITGAPGWLGTRFISYLLDSPNGASRLNVSSVRLFVHPQADLSPLRPYLDRVEIVRGDVRDGSMLPEAMSGRDIVFHLAGVIHPGRISELYAVNAKGTAHVVRAALEAGARRIIYVSSDSAAGCRPAHTRPQSEADPSVPYMHYGRSKWLGEEAVRKATATGAIEAVILRPCWFYGPGQPGRQTRFFRMIKQGRPIVFGRGDNLRSLTHLDNLCQALVLAAQVSPAAGQTYWIADEQPYSMLEIYRTLARLLGTPRLQPLHVPHLASEVCVLFDRALQSLGLYSPEIHVAGQLNKNIVCSIWKAKQELGYRPTVSLEDGMRHSIEWCRRNNIEV